MAPKRTPAKDTEHGTSDADLAQHYGLLDWSQFDPIGEGEAKDAREAGLEFFEDLGDDILEEGGARYLDDEIVSFFCATYP
jgi:hypothetical protein